MHTTTGLRHRASTAGRRAAAMIATVGLVLIGAVATPAAAVESDSAEAEGRVVSGGGTVNLDGIASLAPAYSADPSAPGIVASPLQLSVLSTLGIDLGGGVQLFGPNGVIGVGALEQYASTSEETAYAASGAVTQDGSIAVGGTGPQDNAFVDVSALLSSAALSGITTGLISQLRVELGALSATAGSVGDDLATSDYQIADGTLVFTSPVVQNLTTSLDGALTTLTTTANGITGPTGVLGQALPGIAANLVTPLTTLLRNLTGGLVTVSNVAVTATLTTNLNTALSAVTAAPLTSPDGAVSVNLATGEVRADLARLIANSQGGPYDGTLNNLAPNTEILDPALIQAALDGATQSVLDQIPALLVTTANNTLNSSAMTVRLTANATTLGLQTATINVLASGTVGSFLGTPGAGAPVLTTAGTTLVGLPVGQLLTPLLALVTGTLLPAIVTPLSNAVTGVGIVDTAFRPLVVAAGTALQPITGVINQILSITANVQEAGSFTTPAGFDEGAFTQRAVSIDLLPLLGTPLAEVNLASATVRSAVIPAVDVAITAPLDGDVLTVPDSGATLPLAVTGTGEIGADVSVAAPGLPTQTTVVGTDGTWTVTFPAAGVGTYAVTATQTAGAEVSTASVSVTVEVGEIDDVVITAPADGTVLTVPVDGTTDVVVSGTGQIGADVVVSLPGQADQTVVVGPDGTWTATFTGVDEGTYAVTAAQTVGDQSSSSTVTVVVDEVDAVGITLPVDGTVLTVPESAPETDLTVTGTGDAGADVVVSLTGLPDQTVTVAPDGTWTATFAGVGVGTYTVTAAQTVGDQSTTASVGVTVEVGEIADVAITLPADGATLTVPDGASTVDVAVTGTGQIGAEVVVSATGQTDQTTTVAPDGTWTVTFPAVGTGTYTATASQTVGAETSTASVGFTVEVGEIDDVTISAPTDGQVFTVAVGDETDVVVTGAGQIGAGVVVAVTGQPDQTVTVGPDGTWTATYQDLPAGEYTVTATQTVGAEVSTATVTVEVAEVDDVVITAPADGDVVTVVTGETTDLVVSGTGFVGAEVLVSTPGQPEQTATVGPDGTWTVTFPGLGAGSYPVTAAQTVGDQDSSSTVTVEVAEADAVTITAPADGTVVTVPAGGTTDLVVTGTADPSTGVVVSVPGETDQTAVVAPDGTWTATFPGLGEGTYPVTATQTVGTLTTDATVTVVVDDVTPVTVTAPVAGDVITVPVGGTADLAVVGTGDPGAEVLVTVTDQPDQTVVVDPDGAWTATFPGLGAGSYEVVATQTVGDQTTTVTVPVEVFEVAPLAITSPADGDSLYVATGDGADLVLTGTGSVGADVLVSVPGEPDQETTVGDDGTWTVTFPGLTAGTYTATATQLVGDQLSSESVTVDVVDVDQVAITAPGDGDVISVEAGETTDLVVEGTGDPGADVVVSVTTQPDQTVTVAPDGTWTATFPGLAEGEAPYVVTATQTVGTDVTTSTVQVTVDGVDPVAITAPADGAVYSVPVGGSTALTVTGTGDVGADVLVSISGQPDQAAVVGAGGTWTVTFPGVGVGSYTVVASQVVGGVTSTAEISVSVEVGTIAPVQILAPVSGDVVTVPLGGTTDLVVSGTAEIDGEVVVTIPGEEPQTATVGPDGTWSVTFLGLGEGQHPITATQTAAGQTNQAAITIEVDGVVPVTVVEPADGDVVTVPVGGTTDLVVTGAGDPGAQVLVTVTDQVDQTVVVAPGGTWTATFPGLGGGTYEVTVAQTVGDQSTTETVTVEVDEVVAATITEPVEGDVVTIPAGGTTDLVTEGTGDPGAEVEVTVTGQVPQTVTVAPDGTWTATFPGLDEGTYEVTVTQTVGDQTTTETVTVEIDEVVAATITSPTDGDVITVPEGGTTDLVVTGTGDPGAEVVVRVEGEEPQTVVVAPDGTWTATFPDLPADSYEITVTQTVGDQTTTETVTVEVDGVVPATITAPADGDVVPVAAGGTTDLETSGTGDPGAEVVVSVEGEEPQTVVVAPDGTWTATFPGLGEGTYDVTVTQTVGDQTTTETVTVQVDGVDAVAITAPADGDVLYVADGGTTGLVVTGAGDAGADVVVSVTGQPDQTVTVSPGGTWTATFPGLGEGAYTVTASQTVGTVVSTTEVAVTVEVAAAVAITTPLDGAVFSVPDGGSTDLVVTGTGAAGAAVVASISGQPDQETTVAPDGTWTVTFPGLGVGSYEVTVGQLAGTVSSTDDVSVSVEVGTIAQVEILAPATGDVVTVPAGGTTDLVVSGTGQVGGEVVVTIPGEEPQTATVGPDGTWTVTFPALGEGVHPVTATQTAEGQTNQAAVTVEVDGVAPVVITGPGDDTIITVQPSSTASLVVTGTGDLGADVLVSVDGQDDQTVVVGPDGTWTATYAGVSPGIYDITATQTVGDQTTTDTVTVEVQVDVDAAEVDPVTITLPADGDVLTVPDDASLLDVTVVGSGEAGAEVVVTVPGEETQTATVDPEGAWTVTFPDLGVGTYQVTATQTVDTSFTTDTVGVSIEVGEIVPVVITSPEDGSSIWVMPGGTSDLVVAGDGQIGADVVVSVTGQPDRSTTVAPDGTWTVTFEGLGIGAYEVAAVQTVGDVESSDSVGVTVEAMEVTDVLITSPLDGDVITVPAGESTDVVVTGAGQPDAEVVVSVPGWDDQTVTVSPEGTWETTVPEVGVGAYPVTATQTVGDQTSTDSTSFVVAAQAPVGRPFAVVKYSLLVRGAGMTQEVYGTGFVPGETVSGVVRSTPLPLEPVVADAEGNVTLSFSVDEAFELGAHKVYLTGSVSGELGDDQLATGFVVMDMADGFLVTPGGSVIRWPGASAPAMSGSGSSSGLARTGADDLGAGLLAGALLLLTGAGLLAVRRRTGEG